MLHNISKLSIYVLINVSAVHLMMGDIIEFTTSASNCPVQGVFHKNTSGALMFFVKGRNDFAKVGLMKAPCDECEYCIMFDQDECVFLKNERRSGGCTRPMPDCVKNHFEYDSYKGYWISWHNNKYQFGSSTYEATPILSRFIDTVGLQYVTFSADARGGALQWKVILPPKLEKPLKCIMQGELYWTKLENLEPPVDALIGGCDESLLYIIRGLHDRSTIPGTFSRNERKAVIIKNGDVIQTLDKLEILCGYNCIWVPTKHNVIPSGAVVGGYCADTEEPLYIGRAIVNDCVLPGKVQLSHMGCCVCFDSSEVRKEQYDILVNPQHNILKEGNV